jgi:ABC-type hemin transport system ATPase subunit
MISTQNVSLGFGGKKIFDEVNVKFTPGNCYGLIGANGVDQWILFDNYVTFDQYMTEQSSSPLSL